MTIRYRVPQDDNDRGRKYPIDYHTGSNINGRELILEEQESGTEFSNAGIQTRITKLLMTGSAIPYTIVSQKGPALGNEELSPYKIVGQNGSPIKVSDAPFLQGQQQAPVEDLLPPSSEQEQQPELPQYKRPDYIVSLPLPNEFREGMQIREVTYNKMNNTLWIKDANNNHKRSIRMTLENDVPSVHYANLQSKAMEKEGLWSEEAAQALGKWLFNLKE